MIRHATLTLATMLLISFSLSAVSAPPAKVDLCHNGETYNPETQEVEPLSFVITISEKALAAHINNHDDCDSLFSESGEGMECELLDDGETVECEVVQLCECIEDPELET